MSKIKKAIYGLISLFLLVYFVVFLVKGNYEFLIYVLVTALALGLVAWADKHFKFSNVVVSGFGLWVVLHMFGGSLYYGGVKFYDLMIWRLIGEPYSILKYDQFVHFYLYVIAAILIYEIAKKYTKINWFVLLLIIFAAEGVGALNEMIEFSAVVVAGSTGVGGYINNALDLVFNFAGVLLGVFIAHKINKKNE